MKRLIACGILLAIIVPVCIFCIRTAKRHTEQLAVHIETAAGYADAGDFDAAVNELAVVSQLWKKDKMILVIYIERSEVDDVDERIEYIKAPLVTATTDIRGQSKQPHRNCFKA